jgi:hypothetical protein
MLALSKFSVGLVCVWAVFFPSIARADPIVIRSGAVEVGERFTVRPFELSGDRGFSLTGVIGNRGLDPVCGGESSFDCAPGAEASLEFNWSGLDFTGVDATLDGVTYREINTLSSDAFASIELSGSVMLPSAAAGTAILSAPFRMEGLFSTIPPDGEFTNDELVGAGTMTTTWTAVNNPNLPGPRWALAFSRFDFADSAQVPEPGTLLLISAAAAAALARRRRRPA